MGHAMVYGISGEGWSVGQIQSLKAAGFVDFCQVVHSGAGSNSSFVNACNSLKVSPLFNNGNDGIAGCSGDCNAYYANKAAAGYHAAGGESEPPYEVSAIMKNLPFLNYGGEYGDCGYNFSDIFAHGAPNASGRGIAAYLETYIGVSRVAMCANEVVNACVSAKNHGCKEVGLLIGTWMAGHGVGVQTYINIINAMEARGVTCAGVHLWNGFGTSLMGNYTINGNNSIISTLQKTWPPNMTTLKDRFAGVGPGPGPGPGPAPGPTPLPPDSGPGGAATIPGFSDINILPYLSKNHNGQPTAGYHTVQVYLPDAGAKVTLNAAITTREHQAGRE